MPTIDISNLLQSVYNVKDYGARGNGSGDDTAAIQAALDAAGANNGGVVFFPAGTYPVSLRPHPEAPTLGCALVVWSNTTLRGVGMEGTTIKLAANQQTPGDNAGIIIYNRHILGPGEWDTNIAVEDLTVDGNAANQGGGATPILRSYGVATRYVVNFHCTRVRARNIYGTAGSGNAEGFSFEFGGSDYGYFVDCEAVRTAGNTASGFSADASNFVHYVNCVARGMTRSNGFTHNNCSHIHHTNCHAHSNYNADFNSEVSKYVYYTNCHAGGQTTNAVTPTFAANTNLSSNKGFQCVGSTYVQYAACSATHETTYGFAITNVGGSDPQSQEVLLSNCDASNNDVGFFFDITPAAIGTCRMTNCRATGSTTTELSIQPSPGFSPLTYDRLTAPAMPASGTPLRNPYPMACAISLYGGTVSWVTIGTETPGNWSGLYIIQPGEYITITYTAAPSWSWWAI